MIGAAKVPGSCNSGGGSGRWRFAPVTLGRIALSFDVGGRLRRHMRRPALVAADAYGSTL